MVSIVTIKVLYIITTARKRDTREWEGDLIFLHKVVLGAADKSYGVQVAKLAGLPKAAINRAKAVLSRLENNVNSGNLLPDDLPLFSAVLPEKEKSEISNN